MCVSEAWDRWWHLPGQVWSDEVRPAGHSWRGSASFVPSGHLEVSGNVTEQKANIGGSGKDSETTLFEEHGNSIVLILLINK